MVPVELQLPADYRFVGLARLVVVAAARNAGMDEVRREDLRIAVSEATTSAITVRQKREASSPVVLHFGVDGRGFEVTVSGVGPEGVAGTPGAGASPADDGLATTVIRGLVDHVEFVRGQDGEVDLRFALSLSDGVAPLATA